MTYTDAVSLLQRLPRKLAHEQRGGLHYLTYTQPMVGRCEREVPEAIADAVMLAVEAAEQIVADERSVAG